IEPHVQRYIDAQDDYNSIILKAMADRCAEGLAEMMHHRVRTCYWGYQPDENLDNEQLIREEYQGIRPAPGYPACPDHTEKEKLLDRKSTRLNSSHVKISYAVFCLKKKTA